MFENNTVLHGFLRNVSECTAVNGYFIGTCYDGQTVFDKLKGTENYSIYVDGNMIFDIQKKYKQTGFPDDETGVGYPISVYQESINKYATEYLVNFNYLVRLMGDYGFEVIGLDEAKRMGFPAGSGLFEDLFGQMRKERNLNVYGEASKMTREEKQISFLNRYFIFKKIHIVKADKVIETIKANENAEAFEEAVKDALKQPVMFIKRLKRKVILHKYEPVLQEVEVEVPAEVDKPEEEKKPDAVENKEKKPRCADGTRRFPAMGPDCYSPDQIEEHKKNKTKKVKK
jgi:hypothetical protein